MEEKGIKQCQYCKENMKVDARTCPHCRKRQKNKFDFKILPVIISFSIIAVLVIVYVLTMRSVERERKKSMFDALSDNGGTKISELVEEYKEKVDDVIGHSDESSTENVWETIEPVEIWEGNTVRMYFDDGNLRVMFEFTDGDIARQVYNFFTIYNALKTSQDTFSIYAFINNVQDSIGDFGYIVYAKGESILRELPDLWEEFIDESKINDKEISIESSVSEDIQKADQQKLIEAINNAVQK